MLGCHLTEMRDHSPQHVRYISLSFLFQSVIIYKNIRSLNICSNADLQILVELLKWRNHSAGRSQKVSRELHRGKTVSTAPDKTWLIQRNSRQKSCIPREGSEPPCLAGVINTMALWETTWAHTKIPVGPRRVCVDFWIDTGGQVSLIRNKITWIQNPATTNWNVQELMGL